MRRVIAILLAGSVALAFWGTLLDADAAARSAIERIPATTARAFRLPEHPAFMDGSEACALLEAAAEAHDANVIRIVAEATGTGRTAICTYIHCEGQSGHLRAMQAASVRPLFGHGISDDWSTSACDRVTAGETVVLPDLRGNDSITIEPLENSLDAVSPRGRYWVEVASEEQYLAFLSTLARLADEHSHAPEWQPGLSSADFEGTSGMLAPGQGDSTPGSLLGQLGWLAALLAGTLIVRDAWGRSGTLAAMKARDGALRTWGGAVGHPTGVVLAVCLVAATVAALAVPACTASFLADVTARCAFTLIPALAGLGATLGYIGLLDPREDVETQPGVRVMLAVSGLVLVVATVAVSLMLAALMQSGTSLLAGGGPAAGWSPPAGYGVLDPLAVGEDGAEVESGMPTVTSAVAFGLYPILNQRGALFCDARDFRSRESPSGTAFDAIPMLEVNPNYLERYPVIDTDGRAVEITEDVSEWIVLVPERYRSQGPAIADQLRSERTGSEGVEGLYAAERRVYGRAVPASILGQPVTIIWIENGQALPTLDPAIPGDGAGSLIDPVIEVVTEANSLCVDRADMASGGGVSDPLKIVLNGGEDAARVALRPALEREWLDDNYPQVISLDDAVAEEARIAYRAMLPLVALSVAGIGTLALLASNWASVAWIAYGTSICERTASGAGVSTVYREHFELVTLGAVLGLLLLAIVTPVLPGVLGGAIGGMAITASAVAIWSLVLVLSTWSLVRRCARDGLKVDARRSL